MEENNGRVLITGDAGFIGRHLRRYLESRGYVVWGIDRLASRPEIDGRSRFACDLSTHGSDVTLSYCVSQVDRVYHLAGTASVAYCEAHVAEAYSDLIAAARVMETCARYKKPVVVASSSYVYHSESGPPYLKIRCAPTIYGRVKGAIENLALVFGETRGLKFGVARLFNVYGPGQDKAVTYKGTFITDTVAKMLTNNYEELEEVVVKNPDVSRDFIYIDDVVSALGIIMSHISISFDPSSPELWPCYDVGSGESTKLMAATQVIAEVSGFKGTLKPGENSLVDIYFGRYPADITRLGDLGWRPTVSFRDGVSQVVSAMQGKTGGK